MIDVSLAYMSSTGGVVYQEWAVPEGTPLISAIYQSAFTKHQDFTAFRAWADAQALDDSPNHQAWFVGVFSQKKALGTPLQAGDRIEIYRPLLLDPMLIRQKKVQRKQKAQARALSQGNKQA